MPYFGASLTDDANSIIYNRKIFMILVIGQLVENLTTDPEIKGLNLAITRHQEIIANKKYQSSQYQWLRLDLTVVHCKNDRTSCFE